LKQVLPFDLLHTPIENGVTVLEASAGTGKTYALAGLFLRCVLSQKIPHEKILVVTYTEAATAELWERIRSRIVEALQVFEGAVTSDPLLQRLKADAEVTRDGLSAAVATLAQVLGRFDETPIFTIHSFCQRVLRDRAFETGGLFDLTLVPDHRPLYSELALDWWRDQFYTEPPVRHAIAAFGGLDLNHLTRLLMDAERYPGVDWVSGAAARDLPGLLSVLDEIMLRLRCLWMEESPRIRALFGDGVTWAKVPYNRSDRVNPLLEAVARWLSDGGTISDFSAFKKFTPDALAEGTRAKGGVTPVHAFFEACEALMVVAGKLKAAWELSFLDWAAQQISSRKQQRKEQSFSDLLTRLGHALRSPGATDWIQAVRAQYQVALVDEFQDTDSIQWDIFQRLFANDRHALFLIGDPKQAIYGFRGADVYTYLEAARSADRLYSLSTNWRSERLLVEGVNQLFHRRGNIFITRDITFTPVSAAGQADKLPLTVAGRRLPPLRGWFVDAPDPCPKTEAEPRMAVHVASEIVDLLGMEVHIGERALEAGDIAVLVETHRQAEWVREELRRRGVPSVQRTQKGIFESEEARHLTAWMRSLLEPSNDRLLRGALVSPIGGLDAAAVLALDVNESGTTLWVERTRGWALLWASRGIFSLMRRLLVELGARRRLLALPDGERRLTNYLHLAELVDAAALERRLSCSGQLQWLLRECASDASPGDEQILRLERDDDAVQLVTVHASKGLEYPVVFAPFVFKQAQPAGNRQATESVVFHDPHRPGRLVRDLGSPAIDTHRQISRTERLAESVRLLYVALTRASHRCYFSWGNFSTTTTAMDWLLGGDAVSAESPTLVDDLATAVGGQTGSQRLQRLAASISPKPEDGSPMEWVTGLPSHSRAVRSPPIPESRLVPRRMLRTISHDWRIASFSWLSSSAAEETVAGEDLIVDRDGTLPNDLSPIEILPEPGSIHSFPRGAEAGSCLHQVLERVDFASSSIAEVEKIATDCLAEFGLPLEFVPTVTALVQNLSAARIVDRHDDFCLADVPQSHRIAELEFLLPLRRFQTSDLVALLQRHAHELPDGFATAMQQIGTQIVEGALRGFIDWVFFARGRYWLIDWKSNWLGPTSGDYTTAAMEEEMVSKLYPLQYLLYVLALDRWLDQRLPDYHYSQHFGGVRYLFVRGLDSRNPNSGVYPARPSEELITELRSLLLAPARRAEDGADSETGGAE
jgi:exodeoxyribonuclease V beta subunit